jgi:hypothetical protein
MPSAKAAPSFDKLLHCSPARTVVARLDPARGELVVAKIYVAGAMADAEREYEMGRLADGPGVIAHLGVGLDPTTSRPCVTTRAEDGTDLDRLVGAGGPMTASSACAVLAPVATTLARLHALAGDSTPRGLCHGDVKPKNLLRTDTTTLLLDFEHAQPIGNASGPALGTVGFMAPEAERGAPSAAIDVHALGATLQWLLQGGMPAAMPLDPRLERLIAACTAADPDRRPAAAAVAEQLAELAAALRDDPREAVLADWSRGRCELPDVAPDDDPRCRPWPHRRRLLVRLRQLRDLPEAVPTEPQPLAIALRTTSRLLQRFPAHPALLRWRADLQRATGMLLGMAARHVAAHCKLEAFALAQTWLTETGALVRYAAALPGGLSLPADEPAAAPTLLQRDPLALLQRLAGQVEAARAELDEHTAPIAAAIRSFDLRGAEAALDRLASRHGGASPTVARHRDQLHRLGFYLDRVARAEATVERVVSSWDATALRPLTMLVAGAARARPRRTDTTTGNVGLRSLQLTLLNLAEEFPALAPVSPAHDALSQALADITDQAWELLADARAKLQTIPVPVRPLHLALGRLDSYRILEAFVDRPQRPRSQLQDGIETLRLALEQARATRDRLAETAESALARGHWTTGLFEMERAVAGLQPGDDNEHTEATRLQERLASVRRRKEEVESTVRRNIDLATLHGTLQDDPSSTFAARLKVLEERRDCLTFLTMHVPTERSILYHRDLRDVETQIALERAGLAEHQLDGTVDVHERLRFSRSTLEQLTSSPMTPTPGQEPAGRIVRLVEHWRTLTAQCQHAVDQLVAAETLRRRQKRRVRAVVFAAIVVTTTAVAFAVRPWLIGEPANAAGKAAPPSREAGK